MEAVTYRDAAVVSAVAREVVPVQVAAKEDASRPIVERYLQVWTPTIFLLSPAGGVYHEWNGYLPPTDYLAELELGLGKAQLRERRFGRAATIFEDLRDNRPRSHVAAEATYWAAVARYNESDQAEGLMAGWQKLRDRYPESIWRVKQLMYELDEGPTSSRPRSG